jgi:hypothetical protein
MARMRPEVLLKAYVLHRSDEAFRELVAGCIDEVYANAFELSNGATHLAEEITVEVFWELARRASGIGEEVELAAWLKEHTCKAASQILREAGREVERKRQGADTAGGKTAGRIVQAPEGLSTRVCQSVLLNVARRKSFLMMPKLPELKWAKPVHARIAGACALLVLLLAYAPRWWHRQNPIIPSQRNVQLRPSSFAQMASPEDNEAPSQPSKTAPIETGSNQP